MDDLVKRVAARHLEANALKIRNAKAELGLLVINDEVLRNIQGEARNISVNGTLTYMVYGRPGTGLGVTNKVFFMITRDPDFVDLWKVNADSIIVTGLSGPRVGHSFAPMLQPFTDAIVARMKREGRLD